MSPEAFFKFARERHGIYIRRHGGQPAPWTVDPILASTRFTNVFRELDRTTIWFRENIRDPLATSPWVVPATIIFRWFNRIETGELIKHFILNADGLPFNPRLWTEVIEAWVREHNPKGPWVTGSYMVCSGFNTGDKLKGMMRYSRMMVEWWQSEGFNTFFEVEGNRVKAKLNLQAAHVELMKLEGLAGFTAYEVVTDLRYTTAVRQTDVMTWAHAGPGATRGASRVMGEEPDHLSQHSKTDQLILNQIMRELLTMSRDKKYWPKAPLWPKWELRDVEHTLCEFDKYERVRRDQGRAKRSFNPTGACPLPGATI